MPWLSIRETVALGFESEKQVHSLASGGSRRGFVIKTRPSPSHARRRQFDQESAEAALEAVQAAGKGEPTTSSLFTRGGKLLVPIPLLETRGVPEVLRLLAECDDVDTKAKAKALLATRDPTKAQWRFSESSYLLWGEKDGDGCPWFQGKPVTLERLLAKGPDSRKRWVWFTPADDVLNVEAAFQNPPNQDRVGVVEADGLGVNPTKFRRFSGRTGDDIPGLGRPMSPRLAYIKTGTGGGTITLRRRKTVPKSDVETIDGYAQAEEPDPAIYATDEETRDLIGLKPPKRRKGVSRRHSAAGGRASSVTSCGGDTSARKALPASGSPLGESPSTWCGVAAWSGCFTTSAPTPKRSVSSDGRWRQRRHKPPRTFHSSVR